MFACNWKEWMNVKLSELQKVSFLLLLYAKDYVEKSVKARYYCLPKIVWAMPNKEMSLRI